MAEFVSMHNGKVKMLRGKRGGHGFPRDPEAREDRLHRDNLRRRADANQLREQLAVIGSAGDDQVLGGTHVFCSATGLMVPANGAVSLETGDGRSEVTIVYKDGVAASACCHGI